LHGGNSEICLTGWICRGWKNLSSVFAWCKLGDLFNWLDLPGLEKYSFWNCMVDKNLKLIKFDICTTGWICRGWKNIPSGIAWWTKI